MAIYGHIWLYILCDYMRLYVAKYEHIHPKICIWGVWTCILGVWTCIFVPKLVFWVSGLVFWVSGLVFWVSVYLQDVTMVCTLADPGPQSRAPWIRARRGGEQSVVIVL